MQTIDLRKALQEFNVQTSNNYRFERDLVYLHQEQKDLNRVFETGEEKGTKCGIISLNPHFLWLKSYINVFGGIPNHGKSTFLQFICLLKSMFDGTKWGFVAPESKLAYRWYMNLIHSFVGKPVERGSNGQMSNEEFEAAKEFVSQHFYFVRPEKGNFLKNILDAFRNLKIYHGVEGFVIDPYNSLTDWTQAKRDDVMLNYFYDKCNDFLVKNNSYFNVVMHPAGHMRGQKNEKKDYNMPTQYDFAGGAMTYNKADRVAVVHRPFSNSDPKNNLVVISIQKAKEQRLAGLPGEVSLRYDFNSNRYKDFDYVFDLNKDEETPF